MQKNPFTSTLQTLTEQLKELSREQDNPKEMEKLENFKQEILRAFPQAFPSQKFRGRIEQIIIEMNNLYENRIITPDESFNLLLNIYTHQNYGITMSDMQQLNDSIQVHFQEATIRFEVFHSDAFNEDELLLLIEFNS